MEVTVSQGGGDCKGGVCKRGGGVHHPCVLRGPQPRGQSQRWPTPKQKSDITPTFSGVPLQKGTETKGAHKRAEKLHHPCALDGPQTSRQSQRWSATSPLVCRGSQHMGTKSNMAHQTAEVPVFSQAPWKRGRKQTGPTKRQKCYITLVFPRVVKQGDKVKCGPQVGGSATSPLRSHGSPTEGDKNKSGPQLGGSATPPFRSQGSPTEEGTRSKMAHN